MKKIRKNFRLLKCCLAAFLAAAALLCVPSFSVFHFLMPGTISARADNLTDDSFSKLEWKLEFADYKIGTVQSVCTTENYIITIDNVADDPSKNDIVSAYYKNKTDENGNPVKQYSLAKRVSDREWEHGNCMTYNPNTGLIYVALYTNTTGDNAGCVYEMDPNTLEYVGKIQIGDGSYNILGLGYKEDTNQYIMQTDAAGGFSMKLLDANFQIIDDYGPVDPNPGNNFQGLVADGDYAINLPVTVHKKKLGEWMDVFSISRRALIYSAQMNIDLYGSTASEGEGFCKLDEDTLLLVLNIYMKDGAEMVRFYTAEIPGSAGEKVSEKASMSANGAVSENRADSENSGSASGSSSGNAAASLPLNTLNENSVSRKNGSSQVVTEAPAVRGLNSLLSNFEKLLGALVTGNGKALRKFGRNITHGWRTFLHHLHHIHTPRWLPYAILFAVLLVAGPGMLLYMLHLKKARKRLDERTKRLREEILRKMDEDS